MNRGENIFEVPEYAAAVKKENDVRDAAFLDLPADICGVKIRQMTLWHWVVLNAVDSPFLRRMTILPSPESVLVFLWVMSPTFWMLHKLGFRDGRGRVMRFLRRRFIRKNRRINYAGAIENIVLFVRDTFQDCPEGAEEVQRQRAPHTSFAAGLVNTIALEYRWSEREVVFMSLKRAFQYHKLIDGLNQARTGEGVVMMNPSDAVRSKVIREERERREKAKLHPGQQIDD